MDGRHFLSQRPTEIQGALRRNEECPQCRKYYLTFPSFGFVGDQSVCQTCADKNFAPTRDKMQKIERVYAEVDLQRRINNKPTAEELDREYHITGPFLALSGATT